MTHYSKLEAIIFDLVGTLGSFHNKISHEKVSDLLVERGYEIFHQAYEAAFRFTIFVDYPKFGYSSYESMLGKVLKHLGADIDDASFHDVINL